MHIFTGIIFAQYSYRTELKKWLGILCIYTVDIILHSGTVTCVYIYACKSIHVMQSIHVLSANHLSWLKMNVTKLINGFKYGIFKVWNKQSGRMKNEKKYLQEKLYYFIYPVLSERNTFCRWDFSNCWFIIANVIWVAVINYL